MFQTQKGTTIKSIIYQGIPQVPYKISKLNPKRTQHQWNRKERPIFWSFKWPRKLSHTMGEHRATMVHRVHIVHVMYTYPSHVYEFLLSCDDTICNKCTLRRRTTKSCAILIFIAVVLNCWRGIYLGLESLSALVLCVLSYLTSCIQECRPYAAAIDILAVGGNSCSNSSCLTTGEAYCRNSKVLLNRGWTPPTATWPRINHTGGIAWTPQAIAAIEPPGWRLLASVSYPTPHQQF